MFARTQIILVINLFLLPFFFMENTSNSWNTLTTIKNILIRIPFLSHYKEQKYMNIIHFLFFVFFFFAILKRIIPVPVALVFMAIIRLIFEWFAYTLRSINKPQEVETNKTTWEKIIKKKNNKWWFLTFLAFIGIIISLFVPIVIMGDNSSISLMDLMTKLNKLNSWLSTYLWGEYNIGQTLKDFVIYSFLSALSVFIGYINRWKILSFVWLFGILFYGRMILSVISNSENASNIFKILDNLDKFGILTREDMGNALLSSPALIIYSISTIFLIIACIKILKGYFDLFNEKTA